MPPMIVAIALLLEPREERRRNRLRLLHRRHVSALFEHDQTRTRKLRMHLLVARKRAPRILPAAQADVLPQFYFQKLEYGTEVVGA